MRPILAAAALAVSLSLAPAPAPAFEAGELKADIESMLDEVRALIAPVALEAGPLEIVPEGAGFRVTLPGLAINDALEGRRFNLGTLSLWVEEPGPGLIGFDDVSLPDRMTVTEAGKEVGWITLDLDRYSGVYSTAIQEFLQLDFLANSLEIRVPKEALLIGAGRMSAWVATVPEHEGQAATGYQRQRQHGSVANLVITSDEGTVEIGSIAVDGGVDGLDLGLYETLVAVIGDLEKAGAAGDQGRLAALRETLTETIGIAQSMRAALQLADIEAFDEAGRPSFALRSAGLSMDLETPRGEAYGSAALSLSGSGLVIDPASDPDLAPFIGLVPTAWNVPLQVEHLPLEALARSAADLIYEAAASPAAMAEQELGNLGQAVLQSLGAAGSYLIVRDLFLEAPLVRLDSKASLAFSPNVDLGVVGNWAFTVTGLDRVLALAESLTDPDSKKMLSAVVLGMMGFGQATALPDGRVGYRYSFSFAPDGTIQMNGFAFGDLLNNAIPQ